MLSIVCGLIGSGKTTYVNKKTGIFTDLDYMPMYTTKKDQIKRTHDLLKHHHHVYHITTFPTAEEIAYFDSVKNKEFIWINTTIDQCKTNILIRNRERDLINLKQVFESNLELDKKLRLTNIMFKKINIFERV